MNYFIFNEYQSIKEHRIIPNTLNLNCYTKAFSALTNKPFKNHGIKPLKIQNCLSQNESQARELNKEEIKSKNKS
jgi:hypothetical protein